MDDHFDRQFGGRPTVAARAPGRVELLGNHTDYHGGLVLAAAVDRFTTVVGRPVPGRRARLISAAFSGEESFDLDAIDADRGAPGSWGRYARGVCWALGSAYGGLKCGFEAAIAGDVPLGAGLSSSASLQAALGMFLLAARGVGGGPPAEGDDARRMALAQTLRRSENEYVGVGSGLLDQFSVLFGREGHALVLDCRTLEFDRLPLGDPAPAIVVCDSKTSRRLADGMYDRRRAEGEDVVNHFRDVLGRADVTQLRDLTADDLADAWDELDPDGRRRARHVVGENDRVRQGAEALRRGELAGFGRLMDESHRSSRDDFENSSPALDALIEAAAGASGHLGGKLSGAGWAGCTVHLVELGAASEFAEVVADGFERRIGHRPAVHVCRAADGAAVVVPG